MTNEELQNIASNMPLPGSIVTRHEAKTPTLEAWVNNNRLWVRRVGEYSSISHSFQLTSPMPDGDVDVNGSGGWRLRQIEA